MRTTATRVPRFPIPTWNVYTRTLEGIDRTNNNVEAWHRRLNALVGKKHPNLYEFLNALKREEQYTESQREDHEGGIPGPKRRKKYIQNDERILSIVLRFNTFVEEDNETGDDEEGEEEDQWRRGMLSYLSRLGFSARATLE